MIRVLFAWAAEIALCSNFSFALSISGMLNLLKYLQTKEMYFWDKSCTIVAFYKARINTYMLKLIFYFSLFLFFHCLWVMYHMVMYEFEPKEKQKLTGIKN